MSTKFSPTTSVRNSCLKWMEEVPLDDDDNNVCPHEHVWKRTVSINDDEIAKLAAEIADSILAKQSLEVTEWDEKNWHYTGKAYRAGPNMKQINSDISPEVGCVPSDDGDDGRNQQKEKDPIFQELMRMERVALYILSLDAINFCFWPTSTAPPPLSQTCNDGKVVVKNGLEYEDLAIALRKIAESDDNDGNIDVNVNDSSERSTLYSNNLKHRCNGSNNAERSTIRAASTYAFSPENLATLTPEKMHSLFQPHLPPPTYENRGDKTIKTIYELPNLKVRCQLWNELGLGLLNQHNGSALRMVCKANQSADVLVGIVMDTFPGFRDYVDRDKMHDTVLDAKDSTSWLLSPHASNEAWETSKTSSSAIHFYKRAQIVVADIWAALGRDTISRTPNVSLLNSRSFPHHEKLLTCCHFNDMTSITTFPDYRVPQILRHVGALQYTSSLSKLVDERVELKLGGTEELSIRAGTVVAVEKLVQFMKERLERIASDAFVPSGDVDGEDKLKKVKKISKDVSAVTIDWYLWQWGEKLNRLNILEPHHRVRTIFY